MFHRFQERRTKLPASATSPPPDAARPAPIHRSPQPGWPAGFFCVAHAASRAHAESGGGVHRREPSASRPVPPPVERARPPDAKRRREPLPWSAAANCRPCVVGDRAAAAPHAVGRQRGGGPADRPRGLNDTTRHCRRRLRHATSKLPPPEGADGCGRTHSSAPPTPDGTIPGVPRKLRGSRVATSRRRSAQRVAQAAALGEDRPRRPAMELPAGATRRLGHVVSTAPKCAADPGARSLQVSRGCRAQPQG